ncbi:hypothetical protein SLS60_002234 [Paraconiothyrium brasiliense]|uniref:F-box domain-containing protein n=1 Tax=Paraconiothyrium brasiliense TaxID=300254 RepID=A0ABR3S1L1_9PLEO
MLQVTLEPDAKLCRLLLLPPELREMIWNEFRNSTRALCLERKVMNCPEAMATIFNMYRDVALHHVLALDNTMWSSAACKPLKTFLGAQDELQTACIPVVGSADVQAVLNSIIRIKVPGMKDKKHLSIIINRYSDLDIVKSLIDRPGREVKDITLFGNQLQGATLEAWADTLTHQGLTSPCNVSRFWLHLCKLNSLSRHLNKDVIESLGVFNCAYDASSAVAMNAFISDILDQKKAKKNTKLKEFIHTNFINNTGAEEAYGITDANLCKLAETVTGVVALAVRKDTRSDLDLTQVIHRWSETLRVVAWNMKGNPLGFNTIRQLAISTPKLEALGIASNEAIKGGGGLLHLQTLLFFFPELPMNHGFLYTLLEALTDVVTILKTYDVAINV